MKVNALVEMPKGTHLKYEESKEYHYIKLDRLLQHRVPSDYGYILETLAQDGDALDIFIMVSTFEPLVPRTLVEVEIIGGYRCNDNGISDDKLMGVFTGSPLNEPDKDAYPAAILEYLTNYKPGFEVIDLMTKEEAEKVYQECCQRLKDQKQATLDTYEAKIF